MIYAMTMVIATMVAQADVNSLVKGHEEGVGCIKTLKCTIDERMSVDGGKTWRTMSLRKVWRSNDRERVHLQRFWLYKPGNQFEKIEPVWHLEALFSPESITTMDGYDPDHPPREPITVANEKVTGRRLGGMIRSPEPHKPWGYKGLVAGAYGADFLLFFLPDGRNSTRDLCEATKGVTPVERRDSQGDPHWDLALKTPDGKSLITLALSPRRGYAILENKGTNIASGSVATRRVVD